jgi:hypothetical protein
MCPLLHPLSAAAPFRIARADAIAHTHARVGAARDPGFAAVVSWGPGGSPHVDWRAHNATAALTAALLRADFALAWSVPDNFLIPPLPQARPPPPPSLPY